MFSIRHALLTSVFLVCSAASAQFSTYASNFGGLTITNARPVSAANTKNLATGIHGLAELQGYTCKAYESYLYPDAVKTIQTFQASAKKKGLSYKGLTQVSQNGQNITLFKASKASLTVVGLWVFAADGSNGTLTLCKATKT